MIKINDDTGEHLNRIKEPLKLQRQLFLSEGTAHEGFPGVRCHLTLELSTHTFSGNPDQTPRYDYNQIMYRLDLADERLTLTP